MPTVKTKRMKINKRKSIILDKEPYCKLSKQGDFMQITEWYNNKGFDVLISNGDARLRFAFTTGEYEMLKKMYKQLVNK